MKLSECSAKGARMKDMYYAKNTRLVTYIFTILDEFQLRVSQIS